MHPASKDLTDSINYFGSENFEENDIEEELIRTLLSNDTNIGYNQWPKHNGEIDG